MTHALASSHISMKRQILPKRNKLSQVSIHEGGSSHLESYFIRYLQFQNKIVRELKSDANEILVS